MMLKWSNIGLNKIKTNLNPMKKGGGGEEEKVIWSSWTNKNLSLLCIVHTYNKNS